MPNDADRKRLAQTISLTTSIAIPFGAMHTHGICCATFGYRRSDQFLVHRHHDGFRDMAYTQLFKGRPPIKLDRMDRSAKSFCYIFNRCPLDRHAKHRTLVVSQADGRIGLPQTVLKPPPIATRAASHFDMAESG